MFPVTEQPNITNEPTISNANNVFNGKAFLYDYEVGDFVYRNGAPVELEGPEALRAWMEKCIQTTRFKALVHKDLDYGPKLDDLIGSTLPNYLVNAEIEREIREAFLRNPYITNIEQFTFSLIEDVLTVDIEVNSIYDKKLRVSI